MDQSTKKIINILLQFKHNVSNLFIVAISYDYKEDLYCVPANLNRPLGKRCESGQTRDCGGIEKCLSEDDCREKCSHNPECSAFIFSIKNSGYTSFNTVGCSHNGYWSTFIKKSGI